MFLLLIFILGILVVIKAIHNFSYWTRHGIPNRPYPTFKWLYKSFDEVLSELLIKNNNKIYGGYRFYSKFLVINDPKLAHDLSIKEIYKFPIRFKAHIGDKILAKSLFFLEVNSDWKRIRAIVSPAFTSEKLKSMTEPMIEIADQLIDNLRHHARSEHVFDIKRYLDGFTLDVIARCAYGVQINSVSQPNHPIIANAKKILNINVSFQQVICVLLPGLAKLLKFNLFDISALQYFDSLTATIIEKRRQSKQNYNDLIGLMMRKHENENVGISSDELSSQSVLFFIAGYDTTNAAFDHILYYLGSHPEWQDKLYDEVKNKDIQVDNLSKYPVLNAIINETLRLKPSLTIINRVANKDCYLLDTGIPIEKGTSISIHPYIIHRDPDYFDEPESFKPERFIDTGLENSIAYIPFGVGPRFCVGMRFALNELRIGVAKFFQNYTVKLPTNFNLKYFNGSVLLSPKELNIILIER